MTNGDDSIPIIEPAEPFLHEDATEVASLDSEIDFDDEQSEDQLPLDEVEAREVGVMLDDPETMEDEGDL